MKWFYKQMIMLDSLPMLSVLITHYNRPHALKACLQAIKDVDFGMPVEIVVSDDGSSLENQEAIKQFKIDTLLLSEKNEGLAGNLNKGLRACKGDYILYCQEDFLLLPEIKIVLPESMGLLDSGILDMVRFRANYQFPQLKKVSKHISAIPKFSFRNFYYNTFQYSDNVFLTTKGFFEAYGYFVNETSGDYGETEYAIRIMKSRAKIGIADKNYTKDHKESKSIIGQNRTKGKKGQYKKWHMFARALRQHLEWLLYNPAERKLYTYKNKRNKA